MDVSEPNQITEQLRKKERVERLAYSIPEAADMLGLDYFSVYRLVQRGKLKACRALAREIPYHPCRTRPTFEY